MSSSPSEMVLFLGEVVSWKVPTEMSLGAVRAALNAAGLDPNLARDMLPRNAFSRAATQMKKGRVITQIDETASELIFQLNQQVKNPSTGEMEFPKECNLTLNKASGVVSSNDPNAANVVAAAQAELDRQIDLRKSSDLTRLVQKVFDQHKGELVAIRPAGGAYFVPFTHATLLDSVQNFLDAIQGNLRRFRVEDNGSGTSASSVADSMTEHFESLVAELKKEIEGVDMNSPPAVIAARVDRIEVLRIKIEAYKDLLQQNAKALLEDMQETEVLYRVQVGLVTQKDADDILGKAKTKNVPEPSETPPAVPVDAVDVLAQYGVLV